MACGPVLLDNLRRQSLLTHHLDHIMGKLRSRSDLVDARFDLRSKPRLLLVRRPVTPPPVVQITPAINEFQHADQTVMRESIVHGCDPTAEARQHEVL
jgi:hypothetical protein